MRLPYQEAHPLFFKGGDKEAEKPSRKFPHNRKTAMPSAFLLKCAPLPVVRIALVGLGQRGMKTLERYAFIKGAEICCIADLFEERLTAANNTLLRDGRPKAVTLSGEKAWREACRRTDIDLVYICTEWATHTMIAVEAMKCGKHVAVEVPAATTLEECRLLVSTAEATQRHCFMTENCCYDFFALETLEMRRQNVFGTITHCEGAYIHNLSVPSRHNGGVSDTRLNWMERSCASHGGNPYPTHGIGPIAQLLGFHRSDRMVTLTSVTARGAEENGNAAGRINSSLITTQNGVSILLQLDVTTPRPYNRLQTVCGTRAFVQKYPVPTVQMAGTLPMTGQAALQEMEKYATSPASRLWKEGRLKGVPNEMNYAMDARLIQCLNQGLPLDIDVYDAAEWSCLAELTQQSASRGGKPVEIPDFFPLSN